MRIPSDVLTRILESADILDVASGSLALKKSGREYKALCPFHEEKTPSFYVNAEKGVYYCRGCHEGGNTIDLLMKLQGLSFMEAARTLASRAGIAIPEGPGTMEEGPETRLKALLDQAQEFFTAKLKGPSGAEARAYLARRAVPQAVVEGYGLGLSPEGWSELTDHFHGRKIPDNDLVQAGLSVPRKDGHGVYDRFRGRLMFPIRNSLGRVVGFGARALKEGDEPKYLNSPEGPVYHKGDVLYGLHESRPLLKPGRPLVLVEGYVDALALAAAGLPAAAPCGTALTDSQARIAGRSASSVTILMDSDEAGRKAALKAFGTLGAAGLEARVALVQGGKDPADLLKEGGPEPVARLASNTMNIVDFYSNAFPAAGGAKALEARMEAARALLPEIRRMRDADARAVYGRYLEEKLGVPWSEAASGEKRPRSLPLSNQPAELSAPQEEERLLRALIAEPSVRADSAARIQRGLFRSTALGELAEALASAPAGANLAALAETLGPEARAWFHRLAVDEERNQGEGPFAGRYLDELTQGRRLKERLQEAMQSLREAESRGDEAKVDELLGTLAGLQRQLRTQP